MKINLAEELKKTDKDDNQVIEIAQKLLDTNYQEERNVLKGLGITREMNYHSEQMSDQIIRKQFREKYGQGIIHIDDIKQACIKYKLRFLPSDHYAGKIDTQLAIEVKKYCAKHNISPNPSYFSILAPAELFQLKKIKGETWMAALAKNLKDPIMFHKLGDGCYRIVHKWGNDFTFMRRLKAYPYQTSLTMFFSLMPLIFVTLFSAISLFTHIFMPGVLGIAAISVAISALYSFLGRYDKEEDNKIFYTSNNWDTDKKI